MFHITWHATQYFSDCLKSNDPTGVVVATRKENSLWTRLYQHRQSDATEVYDN